MANVVVGGGFAWSRSITRRELRYTMVYGQCATDVSAVSLCPFSGTLCRWHVNGDTTNGRVQRAGTPCQIPRDDCCPDDDDHGGSGGVGDTLRGVFRSRRARAPPTSLAEKSSPRQPWGVGKLPKFPDYPGKTRDVTSPELLPPPTLTLPLPHPTDNLPQPDRHSTIPSSH